MALTHDRKFTYEDYCKLPDKPQIELIDGEFFVSPSPNYPHQDVVGELFSHLRDWVKKRELGKVIVAPMDVILSEHDTVQPDLLYIAKERLGMIDKFVKGAPDLAVEVLSPTNFSKDRVIKKDLYEKYGVREYWIIDPELQSVLMFNLEDGRYRVSGNYRTGDTAKSMILPGFEVSVGELFATLK